MAMNTGTIPGVCKEAYPRRFLLVTMLKRGLFKNDQPSCVVILNRGVKAEKRRCKGFIEATKKAQFS